jgi:Peptidase A4 family
MARCMSLMILAAVAVPVLSAGLSVPDAAHSIRPGGPMSPARATGPDVVGAARRTVSANWSGYAAAGRAFRSVSASWTQPAAHCRHGTAYASFWVGLDGYRSRSVEQIGTDADCRGRTAHYYGWYEMYPAPPVRLGRKVRPGDKLSASVTFGAARTYTLVLRDRTRGWKRTITRNQAGLARSSAEVITEAPSSAGGVTPLADFGTVRFTAARVNGILLRRRSPTKIVMIDRRSRRKDTTGALSRTGSFRTIWLRSG